MESCSGTDTCGRAEGGAARQGEPMHAWLQAPSCQRQAAAMPSWLCSVPRLCGMQRGQWRAEASNRRAQPAQAAKGSGTAAAVGGSCLGQAVGRVAGQGGAGYAVDGVGQLDGVGRRLQRRVLCRRGRGVVRRCCGADVGATSTGSAPCSTGLLAGCKAPFGGKTTPCDWSC